MKRRPINDHGLFDMLQIASTLNAFALCLGYQNWQDFKTRKQESHPPPTPPARKIPWKLICSGLAIILIALTLFASHFSSGRNHADASRHCSNPRHCSQRLRPGRQPATISPIRSSLTTTSSNPDGSDGFCRRSSPETESETGEICYALLTPQTLTDIYYEPGYHNAKLIVNDQIIKTIGISIPTDHWFFYSKESLTRGDPGL